MSTQSLLKKPKLRVPFSHLHPVLQHFIAGEYFAVFMINGRPIPTRFMSLRYARKLRAKQELELAVDALGLTAFSNKFSSPIGAMFGFFAVGDAFVRHHIVKVIQKTHESLHQKMNQYGILQTEFEGHYPKDWINPTTVARTHPIFDVERNGDIVFRKVTRREYLQYLMQKKWVGKYGFNTWRWRVYLSPPKAPESVKNWAKAKMKSMLERIPRPTWRPEPRPAFAHAHTKILNRTRRRRI